MISTEAFVDWLQGQLDGDGRQVDVRKQVFKVEWSPSTVNRHGAVYMLVSYYLLHEEDGRPYTLSTGDIATEDIMVRITEVPNGHAR